LNGNRINHKENIPSSRNKPYDEAANAWVIGVFCMALLPSAIQKTPITQAFQQAYDYWNNVLYFIIELKIFNKKFTRSLEISAVEG
jgi:hypothetical protein